MVDIDKLREDLKQESLGAFFEGGFGGALMEACDLDNASEEEIIKIAKGQGINISKYEV